MFFIDNGFPVAGILKSQRETLIPKLAENSVFINLLAKTSLFDEQIFFAESKNFGEVDFVVLGKRLLALKVKWQNSITEEDEKNLASFIKVYPDFTPILITKNTFDLKRKIKRIPLLLFLLLSF